MTISLIVEGRTERAFRASIREFLETRVRGRMPRLRPFVEDGRIPKGDKLRRLVERLLVETDAVIALTDVYTGTRDFRDAADAKSQMRGWVGENDRFYPHAAQYDFEAWLLPYWPRIQKLAGHNRSRPHVSPEKVNHSKPPSRHIEELFRAGTCGRDYVKDRDATRILQGQDLTIAAEECPELKAFLNTILELCGGVRL